MLFVFRFRLVEKNVPPHTPTQLYLIAKSKHSFLTLQLAQTEYALYKLLPGLSDGLPF